MTKQSDDSDDFAGLRSKVSLIVEGKTTREQIDAVEAAVRRLDPDATIAGYPPNSFINITTTASTAALQEAIHSCGLTVAPSNGRRAARGARSVREILKLIGTALLAALFGGIFLPIIAFFLAMILAGLTSNCGAGDSGGCAMWAGTIAIASVPVGAVIAFALAIYGGLKSP
jgi:hypothetical protein